MNITDAEQRPSTTVAVTPSEGSFFVRNADLLLLIFGAVFVVLIPFYGVLYPPLVDLPEHLLTTKLLWEALTGTSNLNIEVSTFVGYKLFPYSMLPVIFVFRSLGISLLYLPLFISMALAALFATCVATILRLELPERSLKSYAKAAGLFLAAIASMYSACWFIGFVNFTLGITFVVVAVFTTERFLNAGGMVNALLVFFSVFLAYAAHPFAPVFWLIWCLGRAIASVVTWSVVAEWKRILLLGVIYLPIPLYHFLATSGTVLAMKTDTLTSVSPFDTWAHWWQVRMGGMFDGTFLRADDLADSRYFAHFAMGLMLTAICVCFVTKPNRGSQKLMLASIALLVVSSLLNESFFPVPAGHWLAYDYRFTSSVYAICMTVSVAVLIRAIPTPSDNRIYRWTFVAISVISAIYSLGHLFSVRSAYARFDEKARPFMEKVLAHEATTDIALPHSKWHPDGTLIRLFICMVEPDCNPDGTTFKHGISGDLFPVKYGPPKPPPTPQATPPEVATRDIQALSDPRGISVDESGNIYVADSGNGRIQKYDPNHQYLATIGARGTGPGELMEPNGVAVDPNGAIYVAEAAGNKLVRFAPDGTFQKEWTGPDKGFYAPRDVAIGPAGQIYIVDQGNTRIVRFDSTTEAFTFWGSHGSGPGQFIEPTGVGVGGGSVFVADRGNDRIQVFDLDGNFVREWQVSAWQKYPWHYPDAAFDELTMTVYTTNGLYNEILAFDAEGKSVTPALEAVGASELGNPSSIVITTTKTQSRLWVLNTGKGTVSQFRIRSSPAVKNRDRRS